jgi:acyl-CoA-binding protein
MPVDFTTLRLREYDASKILNNMILDFPPNVDNKTGVIFDNKRVAQHHFCKVIIYDTGTVYFKGSLHKMYNSLKGVYAPNYDKKRPYKGFNGNNFTYENLCFVIRYLESLFGVNSSCFVLQKIEIGLNLQISVCPKKITSNLLESGGKKFELKYEDNFAKIIRQEYELKIYNKGNHYGMKGNILRVEIKSKRMREFQEAGFKTLKDLTIESLNKALLRLLKRWNDVLLYDCTINKNKLNKGQNIELENKFQHPKYWVSIKANNKDKPKKKYLKIVEDFSANIHKEIAIKIENTNISHFN